MEASDLAARRLIKMTGDERVPYAVRLAAIRDLLDRAALNSKQSVEVQVRRFEELANSGAVTIAMDFPEDDDDVIDGEVVQDRSYYSPEERAAMKSGAEADKPVPQTRDAAPRGQRVEYYDDDAVPPPPRRGGGGRSRTARSARSRKGGAS